MKLIAQDRTRRLLEAKDRMETWACNVIRKHYPGHMFTVTFNLHDQSFRIDHSLMGKACMYIHPKDIHQTGSAERAVINAAGEVLERAGIKRGRLEDWEEVEEARNSKTVKEAFKCR